MIKLIAENIRIESGNRRLMQNKKTGTWFMSPKYRESKSELIAKFLENGTNKTIENEREKIYNSDNVGVKIKIHTYKDIDNPLKMVFDVLEELEYIKNDKCINRILVTKIPIRRGQPDSIYIIIDSLKGD